MEPSICRKAESDARCADAGWGTLTWLANTEIGNASGITVGLVTVRPGQSNPRHTHPNCEEVLYLLSGRLEHTLGDETVTLEAGDVLSITPGCFHNATNRGLEDARMIVAYPCGEREFVLEDAPPKK